MAWTNEETFKFIELFQSEELIWNPRNKYHKDKVKVNDAWNRIANSMDFPVAEVKRKKETLLAAFRVNYKKVVASRKSGSGEADIFRPIWIFYDPLAAFLGKVYKCKALITTEDNLEENVRAEEESSLIESSPKATETRSTPLHKRQRNSNAADLSETTAHVNRALNAVTNILGQRKNDDDCDLYGKLLANKLRYFNVDDRQELMYEIDGLILKKKKSVNIPLDTSTTSYTPNTSTLPSTSHASSVDSFYTSEVNQPLLHRPYLNTFSNPPSSFHYYNQPLHHVYDTSSQNQHSTRAHSPIDSRPETAYHHQQPGISGACYDSELCDE